MAHDKTATPTIGDNLARIRRRRQLTQEELAEASAVSVETIRKLEQGDRTTARIKTLNDLARALGVRTQTLFGSSGEPAARRERPAEIPMLPLRQVLFPVRGLPAAGDDQEPPPLAEVHDAIRWLDGVYHADDYATAVAAIPRLLVDAGRAARHADESATGEAYTLLARAHQLAGTMLTQLRQFDLAHRALDGALDAADRAGAPLVAASVVTSLTWLLMREGRLNEVEQLAAATADQIEPSFARATPEELATWGWLMLRLAAAAARNNATDTAVEALSAADAAATRMGGRPDLYTPRPASLDAFGPAIVGMKRVETAIIAGETGTALTLAEAVPASVAERPTSNNLNRHRLDVAYAQADQRRYADATETLLQVRADAPSWLRHQRMARDIVSTVAAGRRRAMTDELSSLADLVGLAL
jgi:transcriptional regulator with XRE-family HTH domain